ITFRFLFISTLCIGIAYVLLPVITSQDVFSYIAYARMLVIYHLDPFTTIPTSIYTDSVYPFLFWINQPSIYGPTWLILTAALQWLALGLGLHSVLAIEVLLRLFGLVMHLGATWLLWLLSGHMRDLNVDGWVPETPVQRQKRLRAVLAFAWNPFLLLEACVNAHNDTTILFIVLGALWFLAQSQSRQTRRSPWAYLLAALVLAVAACVKITLLIFLPALLLYLWMRWATRARYQRAVVEVVAASGIYLCTMVLLYAPFWHQESLRYVFQVAPTASRDVNSLYETVASIYAHFSGGSLSDNLAPGTSAEVFSHSLSTILFACVFGIYCLRSIRSPVLINTFPALVSWMAWAWLLYCIIGSPWFWPWYTTTFFGLAALVEAAHAYKKRSVPWLSLFVCLLAVSMMSMYSFGNWVPETSSSFLSQWRWMS
ncbi:MAG TPA: hypothetical protein VKX46_22405, partial [Ktedonobacteraceae bacterium]|nr:hypothetical protein [Ktedonobacteraceae bacterium]